MSLYSKDFEIKGKNAVIAGGAKNLGGQTAKELARFGANLFLHYRSSSDESGAKKLVEEITKAHPDVKVFLYQADLKSSQDVANLFAAAKQKLGSIDIAINNVGKVLKKPISQISEHEFVEMDNVNNKIAFYFIQEAGKNINDNGKIVSIVTSLLAAYTPFYSVYQGTKAPVEYYSKSASKELMSKGVSVNSVAPGPMDTPFFYPQEAKGDVEFYKTCALHSRLTKVEDIVPIIRFLVTEGGWISGQTIYASGGFTAH